MKAVGPTSTTAEIEAFIAETSRRLRGPLDKFERSWLLDDRKEARAELAKRAQPVKS